MSTTSTDWNLLVQTFCPRVSLSRTSPYKDDYWPCAVDWYSSRCTLRDTQDPSFEIVHPTLEQLGENPQETRYLEPDDDSVRGGSAGGAKMYAHIRKSPGVPQDWIDIQYWFFYAYNGKIGGPLPLPFAGAHEGDWEHITVRLSNWRAGVAAEVEAVFFAAHGHREGTWLVKRSDEPKGGHYALVDGTHPVVFSAWHSHASYENSGIHWRENTGYFAQDFASGGYDWGPAGVAELVAVDADLDAGIPPAAWLAYGGHWGSSGPGAEASPQGPSHQDPWRDDGVNGFYIQLEPLDTFGWDWGKSRETTSVALGVLGRQQVLAAGRNQGDHTRLAVYGWQDGSLEEIATGASDWGSSYGVTGVALGLFADRPVLGAGRSAGKNSRFVLYTLEDGSLSPLASGGSDWGNGRVATDIAIGALDGGRQVVGVTRSFGDHSRFQIYGWENDRLVGIAGGGSDWGKSRGGTAIAFGVMNDQQVVAVGRSRGDNSRFSLYTLSGTVLEWLASGGFDWGDSREVTALDFGVFAGQAALAVGRNAGDHSRFAVYVWDDATGELRTLIGDGGSDWSSGYGCTGISLGLVNGEGVLGVSRSAGSGGKVFVYRWVDGELEEAGEAGADWGSGRSATDVALGELGGMDVVAYGRSHGDNSRGGVMKWVV